MRTKTASICVGMLLLSAATARGGRVDNVALTLGTLGFDLSGFRNPLSGGLEISGVNRFFNDTLDAGSWELTLNGPLSFQLSTGGRLLPQVDVSFGTNLTRDGVPVPFNYDVDFDAGAQQRQVDGGLRVDGDFSVKRYGFYSINLNVASQQNISNEGALGTGTEQLDFSIGPIRVRGNVYVDVLAVIAQPFFEATGQTNVFETISGRAQLLSILDDQADAVLRDLAEAPANIEDRITGLFDAAGGRLVVSFLDGRLRSAFKQRLAGGVVPEPTVLVLMLLGIPAVLKRRRSR